MKDSATIRSLTSAGAAECPWSSRSDEHPLPSARALERKVIHMVKPVRDWIDLGSSPPRVKLLAHRFAQQHSSTAAQHSIQFFDPSTVQMCPMPPAERYIARNVRFISYALF